MQFQKLDVWKRSFQLAKHINLDVRGCKDFSFKDQICRSALSVPSNIAEGEERETNAEAARFLYIAKGSCGELYTQILLGKEIGYLSEENADHYLKDSLKHIKDACRFDQIQKRACQITCPFSRNQDLETRF
ncbi:four helix bundle protein [Photobacterium aphoticum]|uniref:four helix bundle protein n=1 Tax=Photobacterium aphoticum TaxID=754436 RepID=UPI000AAA91C2|nr:four helix bundle protein [Photobacterium aphoticum]GHA39091.1 hypothetical protein GCM10007086_10800 [Photobacterium aphoticum]